MKTIRDTVGIGRRRGQTISAHSIEIPRDTVPPAIEETAYDRACKAVDEVELALMTARERYDIALRRAPRRQDLHPIPALPKSGSPREVLAYIDICEDPHKPYFMDLVAFTERRMKYNVKDEQYFEARILYLQESQRITSEYADSLAYLIEAHKILMSLMDCGFIEEGDLSKLTRSDAP